MKTYFYLAILVTCACSGQPAHPDSGGPEGGGLDGPAPMCGALAVKGLKIATTMGANPLDPLGYPPYAADACQLAYVAADGSLVLRDLTAGGDVTIADASEKPRRPSVAGGIVAWEATIASKDVVRWRDRAGNASTIDGTFARAGEPRAASDAIAFTAWMTADPQGDTDVLLFSIEGKTLATIGTGSAQQRFADIDATRIAFTDFSEGGPTGAFEPDLMSDAGYSPSDVVVYDRGTKSLTVRPHSGKQAFPLLVAGGLVAYLDWDRVRPLPKFFRWRARHWFRDRCGGLNKIPFFGPLHCHYPLEVV